MGGSADPADETAADEGGVHHRLAVCWLAVLILVQNQAIHTAAGGIRS